MFGFFKVTELTGEDAQDTAFIAKVESQMNASIKGTLYLPPYLRPNQCNIAEGSVVWGCLDEVTGRGCAMFGKDDADFGYFYDANIQIRQNLSVTGNAAIGGDSSVNGNSAVSGNMTAGGNVTAVDCRITIAALQVPNPDWVDDGNQTDPDAHGEPRYNTVPAAVSSLAQHTHTCAAPGSPTTPPIPTPIPS